MTVRAGVEQHTWTHVDYEGAVGVLSAYARKTLPYCLAAVVAVSTILFAMSCKASSVAFRNGSRVSTLAVEVAETPADRMMGLMGRKSLTADSGMLFDFGTTVDTAFWMKDTSIPLSIAFIGTDGKVLAIRDMKPFDETPVRSPGAYRYAIEVNRGWFAANGITAGSTALIDSPH
jgi:uncharacterized membrane protein (UPF0127 family)